MAKRRYRKVEATKLYKLDGTGTSVCDQALYRLVLMSPDVSIVANAYLKNRPDRQERKTYNGQDPFAELMLHLIEAYFCFIQAQIEVQDQIRKYSESGTIVPARYENVLSQMLMFEPALLQVAGMSVDMHSAVWKQTIKKFARRNCLMEPVPEEPTSVPESESGPITPSEEPSSP